MWLKPSCSPHWTRAVPAPWVRRERRAKLTTRVKERNAWQINHGNNGMDYNGLWWVMMGYWVPHFDMITRVDLDTIGVAPSIFFAKTTVEILCLRFAWMVRG
jgi:hypothetical protein